MENQCLICNKSYKSYASLWNHNKKYHKEETITKEIVQNQHQHQHQPQIEIQINCKNCEKLFNTRQSKWRHEKICKKEVSNEELAEKLLKLEKELDDFKNKPVQTVINNINQGVINKGPNGKTFITRVGTNTSGPVYNFLSKPGNENLNILTQKEIEYIMDQQFNCVVSMIELLNFNNEIPSKRKYIKPY
jgi:hypothetical protein